MRDKAQVEALTLLAYVIGECLIFRILCHHYGVGLLCLHPQGLPEPHKCMLQCLRFFISGE